jgi:general secretion pathway protein I
MRTRRRLQGFTILEVMIAIVILSVGLTSLFASEAGAVRVAQRARTTTIATLLARCKMGEIEEKIAKDGFTTNSIDERDQCCDGAEHDGFRCVWKVERIVLPELDSTPEDAAKKATEKLKGQGEKSAAKDDAKKDDGKTPPGEKDAVKPDDPSTSLIGAGAGGDMLASLLLEMSFPVMKPIIEENVRRVTVSVEWKEGGREYTFDVVQFIVNEALGMVPTIDDDNAQNAATPGASNPNSPTGPTTPSNPVR